MPPERQAKGAARLEIIWPSRLRRAVRTASTKSKKTERLTIDVLKLDGERLGVHFWDEHAYMDDGVLLRSNDFENTGPKTGVKNVLETFKIYL